MWGLLLTGLIFGGASIVAAIENADMKSKPTRHLEDGTPVYIDRKCQEWINGEKVIAKYDYNKHDLVYAGEKSGKVYFDPSDAQAKRMHEMYDIPNLERAKRNGKLSCELWYPEYKKMISGPHFLLRYSHSHTYVSPHTHIFLFLPFVSFLLEKNFKN